MSSRDIRICFVGDSFVNGTGDEEKRGWSSRLCALSETDEIEITYYNLGIRRNTSEDVKERWERECELRLPNEAENIVIFSFGVNDTVIENNELRVSKERSIENSRQILVEASKKYQVKTIGPPPIEDAVQNKRIQHLDAAFNLLCDELSIPYLSVFEDLLVEPIWLKEVSSNDGAHPRAGGYSYLGHIVRSWKQWKF